VVRCVRALLARSSGASGDAPVGRALRAIEEQPAHPWTVESLATHVGLSRAALARRFAVQMGEPPLTYLTRWRLALAADLLLGSDQTLAMIASQVGYANAFALSAAFKRVHGESPRSYRRGHAA
ncbi:MAG: AraC family transcriptional regulator, partial [Marmoricola sp.]